MRIHPSAFVLAGLLAVGQAAPSPGSAPPVLRQGPAPEPEPAPEPPPPPPPPAEPDESGPAPDVATPAESEEEQVQTQSGCACRRTPDTYAAPPPEYAAAPAVGGDRDGDGIADADDQCLAEPEDHDAFQDEDGCPDPDNDGDTIVDSRDKCPLEPETLNGYEDDDGCPDRSGPIVQSPPQRQQAAPRPVEPPRPEPARPQAAPPPVEPARPSRTFATGDQQRWVMAVMNIEVPSGDRVLGQTFLRGLENQIRVFLGARKMRVIDRGAQEAALKEMINEEKKRSYAACVDASCQIPLGKALAATHILRLSIARFDATCTINGELIELKTEVSPIAASVRSACKQGDLLDAAEKLADQLISESK